MRMLSALLLLSAAVMLGLWVTSRQRRRLRNTALLRDLAAETGTLLRCTCPPVTELMQTLSRENRFEAFAFLQICCELLQADWDFVSAWVEALTQSPPILRTDVAEKLREFGCATGKSDLPAQLNHCKCYEAYFAEASAREQAEYEKNKRLYPTLFLAAGVCAALWVL